MSFIVTLWPSTTPELLRRKNSSLISCSPSRLPHDSWALRIKEKNKDAGGGMCALSCVRLFATPWTVAHQVLLSLGFSRQEYYSGLPFPPPEDELHISYTSCIGRWVLYHRASSEAPGGGIPDVCWAMWPQIQSPLAKADSLCVCLLV